VPTPYGQATLRLQAGTQTGSVHRLRGKGLPRIGESGHGDLHVRVHVWTPTKVTAEQRRVLEALAEIEGAPPTEGTGRQIWEDLKRALGL
jgi:molecular chaperone DnaJ